VQKLEFIVDVDLFATDTSKYADIILPTCSSVERSELRCYPQKYVIFTTPVIEPLGESRSDTDIIFALADRLGLDFEPSDQPLGGTYLPNGAPDFGRAFEATLDWILEPSGVKIEELKKHPAGMAVPNPIPVTFKKYEKNGFPTPSGKMEFASSILEKYSDRAGIDGLPTYAEDKYSPISDPERAKDYPFILGTGTRLPMFIHSRTFRLPWTRSLRPDPAADLNPADAVRLGIVQGDDIELSTPTGSIRVKANVTELAYPGVVHMYHAYPEADVNSLIEGDYLDPISGFPGYKGLLCAVRKVAPTETDIPEVTR
jgi:anaerobic selenocysteine-containing dehydrogenase